MWNNVKCGYDSEDETANFGTRAVAVGSDGLFETTTVATISSDSQDEDSELYVKSTFHSQLGLVVAVNNVLAIFNEDWRELKSTLAFTAIIDCFHVSQNRSFVFIGLSNGSFQCFSIKTGKIAFTSTFDEPPEDGRTFVSIIDHGADSYEELFVFFSSGAVYRISGFFLPSESHKESLFNGTVYSVSNITDVENDASITSPLSDDSKLSAHNVEKDASFTNLAVEKIEQLNIKVLSVFSTTENGLCQIAVCGYSIYALFTLEEAVTPICLKTELDLRKIAVIKEKLIIAISDAHELVMICPFSLTPIYVWKKKKIRDFALFEDSDQDIMVLTDEEDPCIQMLTIPGFQVKLSFQMEETGFLVNKISSFEQFYFLEKCSGVKSIHIKAVAESMPYFRLERLLKKGRFDKAEEFAKQFELPLEVVYKAILRKLSQDLQPWTESSKPVKENFTRAIELLNKIQDIEFVAEFTFSALLSECSMFHCLLAHTKKKLQAHLLQDPDNERVKELLSKMNAYSIRFDTFLLLDSENKGVDDWLNFSKADLLNQCLCYVRKGELGESRIIWSRHLHEISSQLDESEVCKLFQQIPDGILIDDAVPWLQQVLPYTLDNFPSIITEFVDWFLMKIWELEVKKASEWPAMGVCYSELLLRMISNPRSLVGSEMKKYFWHSSTATSPVKKLIKIIKTLKEINDLYQNYNIYISTTEYFHDSPEEVVFILLNRVPLNKCASLINIFLDKYFLENYLVRDQIISHFVKMEIQQSLQWWQCENNIQEMKIIKLIRCISCIDEKVDCLLPLLTNASIPWSPIVMELADDCLKMYKKKGDSIRNCYNMVPIKKILKKYSFQRILTTKKELAKFVKYIFNTRLDSRLDDALQLVQGQESDLKMLPYFLHLEELIQTGEPEKVSQFLFDNQSDEDLVTECCIYIIEKFSINFNSESFEVIDAVMKTLKAVQIQQRNRSKTSVADRLSMFIKKAEVSKSKFSLKVDYEIELNESRVLEDNTCRSVIRNNYAKIMEGVDKKEESLRAFNTNALKIAGLLNLSFQELVLYLTESAMSFKEFEEAVLIASFVTKNNTELPLGASSVAAKLSSKLMECQSSLSHSIYTSAIPIAKALSALSVIGCSAFTLNKTLETYNKSVLLYEFCSSSTSAEILGSGLSHLYWDPVASVASAPFAAAFILRLYSYCRSVQGVSPAHEASFHNSLLDKSLPSKKPEVPDCVVGFRHTVQRFFGEQQDMKSLKMVCTILWQCASSAANSSSPTKNPLLDHSNIVHSCVSALLKKVLGSKRLDLHLAQFLLHYFTPEKTLQWLSDFINNCGNDCHRLGHVSLSGMEYCKKNGFEAEQKHFYKTYLQCLWSKRLLQFNLSTRDSFKQTEKEQKQLLSKLIMLPDITVQVFIDYCEDFGFDVQEYLLLYLKYLLLSWEPEFEIETDVIGKKKMIVKNSTEALSKRCTEIVSFLENSSSLEEFRSILSVDLWNDVNHYNYEVYHVIVNLLESITHDREYYRKFKLILFFLINYQRLCKPCSMEEEFWETKYSNSQNLPPIAAYRLPIQFVANSWFSTHADMWKVVRSELNIQSYKQWFDVMHVLGIDKNAVCTLAINQMFIEDNRLSENGWCVHKKYVQLLNEVEECVGNVTNLEMASASLYHVVNHLPPGADQLTAVQLCLLQTKQWFATNPSKTSETCLSKVEKKFLTISTTHVLYTNKLAKPDYLNLVLDPHELIKELYHDLSIIERTTNHALHDIDINNAVMQIARLHSVNLVNIRLQLLSTWLQPNNVIQEQSFNETMLFSSEETSASNLDENFIRACYILESDIETSIRYLVGLIFASELDDIKPISVQFRALKCLCAIIPSTELLEEVTARNIETIQSHLQSLMYLNELEKSGLVYSIEGFQSCNKEELIDSLISHRTRQSLKIAVKLCQDFQINNHNLWKNIVLHLVKYLMIDELKIVLPYLNGMFEITNFGEIIEAWNVLLLNMLEKIEHNDQALIEEFQVLMNSCCVCSHLDIEAIKHHCNRISAMHILSHIVSLSSEYDLKTES